MKLLTSPQIRAWDAYTIEHEPIASIDLMERSATKCIGWLTGHLLYDADFVVFCGMGNNGGDGLAIARLLARSGKNVSVYILKTADKGSPDFETNRERLKGLTLQVKEVNNSKDLPAVDEKVVVIDALFGTGLSRPLDELAAELVEYINGLPNTKIAIDIPSGLPADWMSHNADYKNIITVDFTLSFQVPKQSFLFPETGKYTGELVILDIELAKDYLSTIESEYHWIDFAEARSIKNRRNRFSHKGTYGHALLIGGSLGKAGAVIMASKACMKAGAGLTTAFIPRCAYTPLQTAVPEVMAETIQKDDLLDVLPNDTAKYTAIGVGPGMGTQITTRDAFDDFLSAADPAKLVLDADALNCLSLNFSERKKIKLPEGCILTPHPKEFDRMFGESKDSLERLQKQVEAAKKHKVYIVLKGTHTSIAVPTGEVYFNSTGNPGMAKGGSGDVLTGLITSLRAQGYNQKDACILGVYLHGLAADLALENESVESLAAMDIIQYLGKAYMSLYNTGI